MTAIRGSGPRLATGRGGPQPGDSTLPPVPQTAVPLIAVQVGRSGSDATGPLSAPRRASEWSTGLCHRLHLDESALRRTVRTHGISSEVGIAADRAVSLGGGDLGSDEGIVHAVPPGGHRDNHRVDCVVWSRGVRWPCRPVAPTCGRDRGRSRIALKARRPPGPPGVRSGVPGPWVVSRRNRCRRWRCPCRPGSTGPKVSCIGPVGPVPSGAPNRGTGHSST